MTIKNQTSSSPTEETKLADYKEVIADIAYEAALAGYKEDNSRETIDRIIAWADEFTAIHKDTDWDMTDYLETVYRFADGKLETVNMGPKKPSLLAFVDFGDYTHCNNCDTSMLLPIGTEICPICHTEGCMKWVDEEKQELSASHLESQYHVIYKQELPMQEYLTKETLQAEYGLSLEQHANQEQTPAESKREHDSLDEILADTDKCEVFGSIVIDEINNDEETPYKIGSNLIEAYQNGDCDAMLIALSGWSMDSLLDKYNEKRNGDDTDDVCPECGSSLIRYDVHDSLYHCDKCGQTWDS
ncbi:hypothetical protein POZ03_01265 [Bacteroides uniformis]|uniref:hypothetical protein n=1 Tax=Bacteroides uniformis TaxID=820 RepID=UPI00233E9182|nr:hypothetical protein [Bacteroides uniformis]MDC1809087.1 hypothetical protein [Bacteroides uniformis]